VVRGKIELWKRQVEGSGRASIDDLGGLLAKLPEGQQIDREVYNLYTDCVKDKFEMYIEPTDIIRERLTPGQGETPPLPSVGPDEKVCGPQKPGDLVFIYGTNASVVSSFPHTVLSLRGQRVIWINRGPSGEIVVNMDVGR